MEDSQKIEKSIHGLDADIHRLAEKKNHLETLAGKLKSSCDNADRLSRGLRALVKKTKPAKILWIWTPPWEKELLYDVLSSSQRRRLYLYRKQEKSRDR
jgi:hypothetical protein